MPRSSRVLRPALAVVAGLALTTLGLTAPAGAAGGGVGKAFTIQHGIDLDGYDAATTKNGTTYVGWIGDGVNDADARQLHLCVLPRGARSCSGGVQTGNALGSSSATDLKVVVSGNQAELVWIAQVAASTGEFSGVFGTNTISNGKLGTSVSVSGAPTLGTLGAAISHGGGISLAAIGGAGTFDHRVYYYKSVGATPKTLTRPYFVGNVSLADNNKQTVLTTSEYGSLSGKVGLAWKPSGSSAWHGFKNVKQSYTGGGIERVQNAGGRLRLLSMSTKELYTPYIWKWNGKSFGKPRSTGDKTEVSSFDAATDRSGRLVSVDSQSGQMAMSNFGSGLHGARFALKQKQTYAGGIPQITTLTGGRGYVIYSIEKTSSIGQFLMAQPIKLGALTKKVHKHGRGGTTTVTGPASCLPVSTVHTAVSGKAAHGWSVRSKSLHLGSKKQGGSLNGGKLKAGKKYTLKGTVVFAKGGARSSVTAKLTFKTCGRP